MSILQFNKLKALENYEKLPIHKAFNWNDIIDSNKKEENCYLVVFRSVRNKNVNPALLALYDDEAYKEAKNCQGFIYYFKGEIAKDYHCLSFCVWNTKEDAKKTLGKYFHKQAVNFTKTAYTSYKLETYTIRLKDNKLEFILN